MAKIKNITVTDSSSSQRVTIPSAISLIYYNDKNNLEISNNFEDDEAGSKINLVSKGAIQLKPGITKKGKSASIALDSENDTVNPTEVIVQVTNGAEGDYKDKTMRLKLQASEVVLDTKDAYTGDFDPNEIHIKARCDNKENPVYVKHHGRAFDFRCHDHGGIALQIAGKDSNGHENKIKFESDRTNAITEASATYNGEGGKGLEFATFNNEHTSIFTKDYRFNKDGEVYAVTRQTPTLSNDKTDYPTQSDDFKDVIDNGLKCTWGRLIKTASAFNYDVTDSTSNANVKAVETEVTNSGNLRIQTASYHNNEGTEVKPDIMFKPAGNIQFSSNVLAKKNITLTSEVNGGDPISCTFEDIVKLVSWMKENNSGPWTA